MKKALSKEDLYELKSLSQPVVKHDKILVTNNQIDRDQNDYAPQVVTFNADYQPEGAVNPALFASKDAHVTKDNLYYLGKVTPEAPFTLFEHRPAQADSQVSPFPVASFVTANGANKVFFKVMQTAEQPITPDAQFPEVRHIRKEHYFADEYGFLPEDATFELYEYDADTRTQKQLFSSQTDFKLCDSNAAGSKLVLILDNFPDDENNDSNGISVLDTKSGKLQNLTQDYPNWKFITAALSPKATQLLISVQNNLTKAYRSYLLYEYHFADSKFTDVSSDLDENISDMLYLPDSTATFSRRPFAWLNETDFYFRTNVSGHSKFYRSDGVQNQVLFEDDLRVTDWTVNSEGELLVCYTSGVQPSILGTITKDGTLVNQYDVNQTFDEAHAFSKPEKFTYHAKDGLKLEGWLIRPLTSKKTNLPLFLYIHGGPHCAWSDCFFLQMQVLAAAGYGVVLLNPRGSASYGLSFMKANQGAYGGKDYTDLLSGLDDVLAHHPEFDAKKQYVGGLSYGGFMSSWMIGHTDRFAGAVVQNPLTNFISFVGTSDIGVPFTEQELLAQTNAVATLWHFSPLAYADHVTTPTLLMSSEWDKRCPISQGEEFYSALKHRHVAVEMTRFPQSWHAMEEFGLPNLRVKWMAETQRWLDAH